MVKNLPAKTRDAVDLDLIPGSGKSPGVENGNAVHCSCLENHGQRRLVGSSVGSQRVQYD